MNQNAYDVFKYMIIHLLLFLFKNIFSKWLLKIANKESKNDKKEIELMKQKLESLKEQIREISPTSEYAKYAKMERQINNLNDEIKRRESYSFLNNMNNKNSVHFQQDMNIFQKIIHKALNSYIFKFFMYFVNIIEYILLKNEYLEIDYEINKNNILVNYYYNENDNKYYSLIPVYKILISETIVLNSLFNLAQKLF